MIFVDHSPKPLCPCLVESVNLIQCNYFHFRDVGFLSVTQRHKLTGAWWENCTCCNTYRLCWDVPRRSEMWITVWARGIQHLVQDIPRLSQKGICASLYKTQAQIHSLSPTHLLQCWCQDHCVCVWYWYGWEAALLTASLPVSPLECIGVWVCPTTWPSFQTWWSTMIRILQQVIWRWVLT